MRQHHGMPVWAPSNEEMTHIAKRVSMERAKAASDLVRAVKALFQNQHQSGLSGHEAEA